MKKKSSALFSLLFVLICFSNFLFAQMPTTQEVDAIQVLPSSVQSPSQPSSPEPSLSPSFEDIVEHASKDNNRFFFEFLNMLATLGLLVILIFIVTWFLKRMLNSRIQQLNTVSAVKILERRSLTPKTTVYLLEIHGKNVAIVESHNGVTLLTTDFQTKGIKDEKD